MAIMRKSILQSKQNSMSNYSALNTPETYVGKCDFMPTTISSGGSNLSRNRSQPIRFTRRMSYSEIELQEGILIAEYRDYCMFHRIRGHQLPVSSSENSHRDDAPYDLVDEDSHMRYNWDAVDKKSERRSQSSVSDLIDESFDFQRVPIGTSTDTWKPSHTMSQNNALTLSTISDDNIDYIFDMEL